MGVGQNGSLYWRDVLERAAYTCAECGLHDDICVCEDMYATARVERHEQDRRMEFLGYVVFACICAAIGFALGVSL